MYTAVPDDDVVKPEIVLPDQFERMWHGPMAAAPEHALAMCVLWQAIDDLRKFRSARQRRRQRLYREAYRWVASNDRRWPFSFLNLCDLFELSPRALRAELLALSAEPADRAA